MASVAAWIAKMIYAIDWWSAAQMRQVCKCAMSRKARAIRSST